MEEIVVVNPDAFVRQFRFGRKLRKLATNRAVCTPCLYGEHSHCHGCGCACESEFVKLRTATVADLTYPAT